MAGLVELRCEAALNKSHDVSDQRASVDVMSLY